MLCHLNFLCFYIQFFLLSSALKIVHKSAKSRDDIKFSVDIFVCCDENFIRASNSYVTLCIDNCMRLHNLGTKHRSIVRNNDSETRRFL